MQPYQLPALQRPKGDQLLGRWRRFLLSTWRGRILLVALAVSALRWLGLSFLDAPAGLTDTLLFLYAIWGAWRFSRFAMRRLLWRIRTKLLVSYLFIAVVPIVLLFCLFGLAGLLLTGLIGSHMVTSEVDRVVATLETANRVALAALPEDVSSAALLRGLEPALSLHPDARYVLARRGSRVAGSSALPATLPSWIEPPGFAGLARVGETTVLRSVVMERERFLMVEVPLDEKTFAAFEKRAEIRLLTVGGRVRTTQEGVEIRIDGAEQTPLANADEPRGMVFVATPSLTVWETGERQTTSLAFGYQPLDLIRHLSPGALNPGRRDSISSMSMADLLVRAVAVVGVVFLVVYGVALLLGLMLARSITRSIHALSVGTEKLREGNFSHEIKVRSRDQLGELAEHFNVMARGIEDLLRQRADKERLEEELRIARQIQMSLLPPQGAVTLPGLRIAALCLPAAEVGGDYYDLLPLSETRLGVLIADVSGKGTSAALYMAELKGLVASLSRIYESPAKLLIEANTILGANMDSRSFVTMTYAIVDVGAQTMRYARAGHNPILQLQASTRRTRVLTPQGLGLGLDRGRRFEEILEEAEAPLAPGDIFLFFTDGLSEAMNGRSELFGERRLRDILEHSDTLTSEELKERILSEIRSFVGEAAQHDDMTLVVLKVL
jgi:serine phosphatase RsbU (regulator of sigma subunit)